MDRGRWYPTHLLFEYQVDLSRSSRSLQLRSFLVHRPIQGPVVMDI